MSNADIEKRFADPEMIARYEEGPRGFVPGLDHMHRMAAQLLAERAGAEANILVVGAGGGQEIRSFAALQPGWRFEGVDPSAEMLELARRTIGPAMNRVALHQGYTADASEGPFDGASCLLILHFLDEAGRLEVLRQIRQRLRPGAALVVAHGSFPQDEGERELWLDRYAAFAVGSGFDPGEVDGMRESFSKLVGVTTPERDEAMMAEAGFRRTALFYAGLTWRGWVTYA